MMMTLGFFVFQRSTVAPQSSQDERAWRHPGNSRIGTTPAYQFLGKDEETTTLSGTLYPELTGGEVTLELLHTMADTGQAYPLIEGTGRVRGYFVIESTSITRSEFFVDGACRKIDFSIKLKRVDETEGSLESKIKGRITGNIASRLGLQRIASRVGGALGGIIK